MATLCRAYITEDDAHAAVDRVLAAGVADADIRILMGEMRRDARDAPAGSYAGADAPAAEPSPRTPAPRTPAARRWAPSPATRTSSGGAASPTPTARRSRCTATASCACASRRTAP